MKGQVLMQLARVGCLGARDETATLLVLVAHITVDIRACCVMPAALISQLLTT